MAFQVFLFFLILCLAWLWQLSWLYHSPPDSRVGTVRTTIQRPLKPRTPLDCPACRLSPALSSSVEPAPLPVLPWREVKSRRGAPKRIDTQGFACPNYQCPYFGITDAHIQALVGDGTHGRAEQIQTFRGPACHSTFSARRHTSLYRLKTPRSRSRGIVNLFISPDELSPLRAFLDSFKLILHEKRPKKHASSPLFRKNNLIIVLS